jgi:integrase
MARKPVKVYPRGNFYYYQLLEEDGRYGTPHSTHVSAFKPINIAEQQVITILAKGDMPKKRDTGIPKAVIMGQIHRYLQSYALIQKGQEISTNDLLDMLSLNLNGVSLKKDNPLFVEYLLKFWNWEESDYVRDKLAGGFKIGKSYIADNLARIQNHAVPFFDPNLRIKDVNTGLLESFKKHLLTQKITPKTVRNTAQDELSNITPKTISEIIQSIKKPLKEATRLNIIPHNPATGMTPLAKIQKARGILTSAEVKKLFAHTWRNKRAKLANLLSCLTGMREAEIGALQLADLRFDGDKGIIAISHSYERRQKILKSTKNGKPRIVCVPPFMIDRLRELYAENPHEGGAFIFWGSRSDRPMFLRSFIEELRETMEAIGISLDEQAKRNITFHSWRHYYNSALRGAVPDETLRKFVGHEDEAMTNNYDHVTDEQIDSIYKAMEAKILPFVIKEAG